MAYKYWISNEENGGVVANQIPVSIFSIEFDSKPARITSSVSTTRLSTCDNKNGLKWVGCGRQNKTLYLYVVYGIYM